MSDAQKLKDCIAEYRKANKKLDDKLNRIEDDNRRRRKEQADESPRSD